MSTASSKDLSFVMTLDAQQALETNEVVKRETAATAAAVLTNFRRVASIVIGLSIAVFGAQNEMLAVAIESGILVAEMIAAAAAAESFATLGASIAFQYASFVALLNTIFALKNQQREVAARSRGINQFARALSAWR